MFPSTRTSLESVTEMALAVAPDIVIAPLVGFDEACYRLGHGGGFYDRTLATLAARPRIVGVGYTELALRTIYPQPHDVPMDVIVTENGAVARDISQPCS